MVMVRPDRLTKERLKPGHYSYQPHLSSLLKMKNHIVTLKEEEEEGGRRRSRRRSRNVPPTEILNDLKFSTGKVVLASCT